LIIGIDKYETSPQLKKAVADANAVQDYLLHYLAVPSSQICILLDSQATRANILQGIYDLTTNNGIQHGDPILIYYAGHGSTAPPPPGWEAGWPQIELIIPYDRNLDDGKGGKVYGIPDRTLAKLLDRLALAKGNNIVSFSLTSYFSSLDSVLDSHF
jgi:uncharacterized caspase-like protein